MYKIKALILVSFFYQISYTQNKIVIVQYEAVKGNITNKETLLALNSKAIYLIDSLLIENEENVKIIEEDPLNNKITISQISISQIVFFMLLLPPR